MWVVRFQSAEGYLAEMSLELLGLAAQKGLDIIKIIEAEFVVFGGTDWKPILIYKAAIDG